MEVLAANSPFSVRVWQLQWDSFVDPKLKYMFIKNFQEFISRNPSALWTSAQLQRKLMEFNLGTLYWDNKVEQFRVMRLEMGVKLR